jgi:hypothetical protein
MRIEAMSPTAVMTSARKRMSSTWDRLLMVRAAAEG